MSSGVDEGPAATFGDNRDLHRVPRGSWLLVNENTLYAHKSIQQGGFASVWRAHERYAGRTGDDRLVIGDLRTGDQIHDLPGLPSTEFWAMAWDPDGSRLIFQSEREPGNPFYQIYLMDLEDNVEGFEDAGSKDVWLNDPTYQPLRLLAEKLMLETPDWAEVSVAINLIVDPIVSALGLSQLVRRFAPFHGDTVTPFIIGTVERDRERNQAWADAFVDMVTAADVPDAEANSIAIQGWIDKWTPLALDAVDAMAPLFDAIPLCVVTFEDARNQTLDAHRAHIEGLALQVAVGVPA